MDKFITKSALAQAFSLIDKTYVAKVEGKTLSTNDFTSEEKAKLASITSSGIETIKVNDVAQEVNNKTVNIAVPVLNKDNIVTALGFAPMTSAEISAEISTAVGKINTLKYKVVASLPAVADAEKETIYLVPNGTEDKNVYIEYIVIGDSWEKLGDTRLDLSEYAKTAEVATAIEEAKEAIKDEAITEEEVLAIATSDEAVEAIAPKLPILSISAIETIFKAVQNQTTLIQKANGEIVEYETIAEAIEDAVDGETITIHSDVTVPAGTTISDGVTIDLNGFEMTVA